MERDSVWGGRRILSQPTPAPQVPLCSSHEALESKAKGCEGKGKENVDGDSFGMEVLPRPGQPTHCTMTSSAKYNIHVRCTASTGRAIFGDNEALSIQVFPWMVL